jgi:hypothetical protein
MFSVSRQGIGGYVTNAEKRSISPTVTAPRPIKEHLHLVLDAPTREDLTANEDTRSQIATQTKLGAGASAGSQNIVNGGKRKREQPWEKLNGFL